MIGEDTRPLQAALAEPRIKRIEVMTDRKVICTMIQAIASSNRTDLKSFNLKIFLEGKGDVFQVKDGVMLVS